MLALLHFKLYHSATIIKHAKKNQLINIQIQEKHFSNIKTQISILIKQI